MKTIDEVIKANECCDHGEPDSRCEDCPYKGIGSCCLERENDALHYLKEYRSKVHRLDIDIADHHRSFEQLGIEIARYQEAIRNCEEAENKYQQLAQDLGEVGNPPLPWEELKAMEGKPIWVEQHHGDTKGWLLILRKCDDVVTCTTKHGNSFYLYKANYGEKWQAYRKERE